MFRPLLFSFLGFTSTITTLAETSRPHIILVMADDMGWGQTSYNHHPLLKTPNLDAMAAAGLRMDRFYAGAPNCSPTRATVLTGRSNDRAGVQNHGYALRHQEKNLVRTLKEAGYTTGHFGKWHLNGLGGPGVPVLPTDSHSPGKFGFDEWLSVTNFFDRDPLMSRQGEIEERKGDSSEIIVDEALKFLTRHRDSKHPLFAVIWYGTPHSPFLAAENDMKDFDHLPEKSQHHHGELVAMDRSIGALRTGLRDLGMAENTMLVFCSDNGGLPEIEPNTVGGLRGFKNSLYEGGLRVPAIIEWPAVIKARVTEFPVCTMDLFPTIADILGLPDTVLLQPQDGMSIRRLFTEDLKKRDQAIGFRHTGRAAWLDGTMKLVSPSYAKGEFELYDLATDPKETRDLAKEQPEKLASMRAAFLAWNESVENSVLGKDYPEGKVNAGEPPHRRWVNTPEYAPFLGKWKQRREYAGEVKRKTESAR